MRTISRVFIIGNGVAGAENQCFGLVRALGLSHRQTLYRVIRPQGDINKRLQWLPVSLHKKLENVRKLISKDSLPTQIAGRGQRLMPLPAERQVVSDIPEADAKHIATLACEAFAKDGPSLVVASGRDTISISSSIKQLAPEYVFAVQIQHPRSRLNRFDLVITPRHDYYPLTPEGQKQIPWLLRRLITPRTSPERHVILTVGALHQADSNALKDAASTWHDELAPLRRPLLVVNVGGPAGHCRYGTDLALELTALLLNVIPTCGSIRVSFSRRTPCKVSDIIRKELGNHPKVHIWNGEGPNPHMGHLAFADAFVITADSVSMLSEACSTGKPVYVIGAERCTWKFRDFHRSLKNRGVVRPFTGKEDISESWSYSPLNDTKEAAAQVIKALAERGWRLPA
ncbi:PREDICTED: mitochondrial fission protein ELM1-like isoform X1 [Nicotiana attenuata]|uniref:Mitochondrial fission protein elm1 n=1 Tax=Nicotiana attenuata TaxID=49451 RepID=A0A314LDI6_NICAT|nr:PREDICTED: mitochondrial fission protein ELM1-like isoform X1 [Nicotiana attenuata]OIT39705.1 mitochondrial fission protein elm1 [Nicotiana attenuata]